MRKVLQFLLEDLINEGPAAWAWPNYGKLYGKRFEDKRHCHIKKGKPTYVCCWEVIDNEIRIIEVYYVGTHENAPY
ncbi:MAG: hypothetical protein K0R66_23 [Gammaproteobacteria bacterium]|jgi:hypothetical protein|nr:hypothetical protein [Gammaproteobacteria bacterium]